MKKFILNKLYFLGAKSPIPLAIMVSDDTHDLTVQLLKDNHNFGMPEGNFPKEYYYKIKTNIFQDKLQL